MIQNMNMVNHIQHWYISAHTPQLDMCQWLNIYNFYVFVWICKLYFCSPVWNLLIVLFTFYGLLQRMALCFYMRCSYIPSYKPCYGYVNITLNLAYLLILLILSELNKFLSTKRIFQTIVTNNTYMGDNQCHWNMSYSWSVYSAYSQTALNSCFLIKTFYLFIYLNFCFGTTITTQCIDWSLNYGYYHTTYYNERHETGRVIHCQSASLNVYLLFVRKIETRTICVI